MFTRADGLGTSHHLADALGNTIALTDTSAAIQTTYRYEPYGSTTASGAASSNTYKYTGREEDGTGLYYYRARYYDPAIGRFISEDSLEFEGGSLNLYGYAAGSPIDLKDPLGLYAYEDFLYDASNFVSGGRHAFI